MHAPLVAPQKNLEVVSMLTHDPRPIHKAAIYRNLKTRVPTHEVLKCPDLHNNHTSYIWGLPQMFAQLTNRADPL